jgi:26S proteasome regulatory subunit N11
MPQAGTSVTVESVDHVFQTKMLDMLKQTGRCVLGIYPYDGLVLADERLTTGRPEMVVGWYHSHPGFGCWLSNVDVNTQQVRAIVV